MTFSKAIKEQVWLRHAGKVFETKCHIKWCKNTINVFDFTIGHNLAKSRGGSNKIENLHAICSRCNVYMSNKYTIDQWQILGEKFVFKDALFCYKKQEEKKSKKTIKNK